MLMKRTHVSSVTAGGRKASGRVGAELFSAALGGAAVSCPSSMPTYLPGGELTREGAYSMINLWNSDRRQVNLI